MSRMARQALIEDRRRIVAANLLAGLTYREIAQSIHTADGRPVGIGTIARDVQELLKRWRTEQVSLIEEKKSLEERRIDVALNSIWERVTKGEPEAINLFRGLSADRRRLRGLDAPTKIASTDPSGEKPAMTDDERLARIAALIGLVAAPSVAAETADDAPGSPGSE